MALASWSSSGDACRHRFGVDPGLRGMRRSTGSMPYAIVFFAPAGLAKGNLGPCGRRDHRMDGGWLVDQRNECRCIDIWQAIAARSVGWHWRGSRCCAERGTDSGGGKTSFPGTYGWDALALLTNKDHRVVFITVAAVQYPAGGILSVHAAALATTRLQHTSA